MLRHRATAVVGPPSFAKHHWIAFVCLALLVAPGCRIPGLYKPDPGPALPNSYNGRATAENSANIGIYEFFDDIVLAQLLTEGLAQNQELKSRNQEIYIANSEIIARRGAYLPFLEFNGRGGFDRNSRWTPLGAAEDQLVTPTGGEFPDPLPNIRLTTDLFWRIDLWRQYRNARDAALQRYYEAIESRNYLITQLVADTAENYYELAALDKRLQFLNQTIAIQEQSLDVARAQKEAARGTELGVQRFLAEVRKNQAERFVVQQRIIEVQNRINVLVGRFPQPVERTNWDVIKLDSRMIRVGIPAELLRNRRDIQAAEREVAAAGLDVLVARANFFPRLDITANVGFESFDPQYLFNPDALIASAAGNLAAPLINKSAIRAEYFTANGRQLQAIYDYQRTVLNAFTEVVNNVTKAENYRQSVLIKQREVEALEQSVEVARNLFRAPLDEEFARVEYVDVLLATRDLLDARTELLETKQQQLSAIVRAYQALGGGYLITNAGEEFSELFCGPVQVESYEVLQPHEMFNPTSPNEGLELLPAAPPEALPPPPKP